VFTHVSAWKEALFWLIVKVENKTGSFWGGICTYFFGNRGLERKYGRKDGECQALM
jgi:hypothetical protein